MSADSPTSVDRPARPAGEQPQVRGAAGGTWGARLVAAVPLLVLAAVTYLPLLFTKPGRVGADTKTYLYLDPGRLLHDAPFLWDPGIGLGTVTHQNIGYLWPLGPFYWALDAVGLPDWVAQRLWLGTILFSAGAGVLYLLRSLHWDALPSRRTTGAWATRRWDLGLIVAALAYALSPYLLAYAARLSVILLPWAALPWLVALTARSLRHGGWRHPALFALVVLTVGAINATSLILVGLGPLLWVVWAVAFEREVPVRQAVGAVVRIGVLTVVTSLWWVAGLALQGSFGIPILRYTETYQAVAVTSSAPELLRGLGYWFFYGNDKFGQWILPSIGYMSWGAPLSYGLPILAFVSALVTRFRHRAFFVLLIAVGVVVGIGGHPYADPSPAGRIFRDFTNLDAGLAFRSTARAVPLIVLGTAVLLGAGVNALGRALPRLAVPAGLLAVFLVLANMPATWGGNLVDRNLDRDEDVPAYWHEAAAALDAGDHATRVLELPGTDFAAYRWGTTVDPITPGLMDRPYVARELIPYGSHPSANLLNALDRPLQEDTLDPDAVAPIARLLGVGDVVLRSDLAYERYRTPRPRATYRLMNTTPGLGAPTGYGSAEAPNRARPSLPLIDEVELGTDPDLPEPTPVAVYPVEDPEPIIRAVPRDRPMLLAGDGDGLVQAAAAGMVDVNQAIFYSGSFQDDPAALDARIDDDAELVVTDSNRKRARRWSAVRENEGYTERAGEEPLVDDPGDNRLEVFPDTADDAFTVAEHRGGATISATRYGNPITYTPGDRAAQAMDGDPETAWRVGAFSEVEGERLEIDLDEPLTTDRISFLQPQSGVRNRSITGVELRFDGGDAVDATLDDRSLSGEGQTVEFPERTFSHLTVEITADSVGSRVKYTGLSPVGFAEIGLADLTVDELVRPPTDLLEAAGPSSIDHPLSFLFSRQRTNPAEPVRTDEEEAMDRIIDLPAGRSFSLDGTARISAQAPDEVVDALVGLPDAAEGGVTARSSAHLAGKLSARASSAIDGDPATAWESPYETPQGAWVQYTVAEPTTVDHLDLQVVADDHHSLPTQLTITNDEGATATVDLPTIERADELGATVDVPVTFDPMEGRSFRVTLSGVDPLLTQDWYGNAPLPLPVGLAEVGLPGIQVGAPDEDVSDECRRDLLAVGGDPVAVRVLGTSDDAVARRPLALAPCGATRDLTLPDGESILRTAPGNETGVDVDDLQLHSLAGGDPGLDEVPHAPGPEVRVDDEGFVDADLTVVEPEDDFWLVLGQSWNPGWTASVTGDGGGDLGESTLVNGYANGWLVTPSAEGGDLSVRLEWTPQRAVWLAMALSGLGIVACLVLLVVDPRRRRTVGAEAEADAADPGMRPTWSSPLAGIDRPARLAVALGAAAAALVLTTAFSGPAWGVAAGLGALAALRWRWGLPLVRLGAVLGFAGAAGYITLSQVLRRYPADFDWPVRFDATNWPVLLSVALLVIATLVDAAVARRVPGSDEAPAPAGRGTEEGSTPSAS
ncbi:MAG: DUF3367 domain-containing protein [Acidimicrobiales bacterium]|nr:DUF3367 domain-containing protein [Acidimicrobiales bacterium]